MKHYKNVVWLHGHSHLMYQLQSIDDHANIDTSVGYRSVHIPACSIPRTANSGETGCVEMTNESQGYVVDVYPNGIHLRGRDFAKGEFLPIASYWMDTTLQTVAAGTYTG